MTIDAIHLPPGGELVALGVERPFLDHLEERHRIIIVDGMMKAFGIGPIDKASVDLAPVSSDIGVGSSVPLIVPVPGQGSGVFISLRGITRDSLATVLSCLVAAFSSGGSALPHLAAPVAVQAVAAIISNWCRLDEEHLDVVNALIVARARIRRRNGKRTNPTPAEITKHRKRRGRHTSRILAELEAREPRVVEQALDGWQLVL